MLRPTFFFRAKVPTPRFLPAFASPRLLTTSPTSQPSDTSSPAPTPTSSGPSAVATPAPTSLPYLVSRTPSKNLPVYQDAKRGGNLKITQLRKISGDAQALKRNLATELSLQPEQIRLNPVTGHIEIIVSWAPDEPAFQSGLVN